MVEHMPITPLSASKPLTQHTQTSEVQGILLYYKYLPLQGGDAEDVTKFYTELCSRLDLRGRIRVARDGVNVTVGGSMSALQAHAAAVTEHPLLRGSDIDFKLASSGGPRNEITRSETKMDRLVVRLCEELVTLGPLARHRADPRANTAPHLTPEQFHQILEGVIAGLPVPPGEGVSAGSQVVPAPAASGTHLRPEAAAASTVESCPGSTSTAAKRSPLETCVEDVEARGSNTGGRGGALAPAGHAAATLTVASRGSGVEGGDITCIHRTGGNGAAGSVVLLDARNIYETRIGHFDAGPAVTTLDPRTRCFSDLPAWLDAHEELLRNRTVLMYCTGGVRCERASAYLREKGPEFSRVFQLSGGIQRYLERFPGGGYFRGKNFLYDDRIAVGPEVSEQVSPRPWCSSSSSLSPGVVGRCLMCRCSWDDYGARLRCSRCRLLVLICDTCSAAHCHEIDSHQEDPTEENQQRENQQRENRSLGSAGAEAGGHNGTSKGTRPLTSPLPCSPPSAVGCLPGGRKTNGSKLLLCELCSAAAATGFSGPDCSGQADGQSSGQIPADGDGSVERLAAAGDGCAGPAATSNPGSALGAANGLTCGERSPSGIICGGMQTAPAAAQATPVAEADAAVTKKGAGSGEQRRLRILCLHGFRQTGKQFHGRTCALRKKLRDLAEFVFVDAPHALPFFVKASAGGSQDMSGVTDNNAVDSSDDAIASDVKIDGDSAAPESHSIARPAGSNSDGEVHTGLAVAIERSAARREVNAAPPVMQPHAAKRAWLLPPELYGDATGVTGTSGGEDGPLWSPGSWRDAPSFVNEVQYTRQTAGWQESLAAVQIAVRQMGPFDGVFGFSQGAAVAAVLCALQQQQQQRRRPLERAALSIPAAAALQGPKGGGQAGADADAGVTSDCDFGFRFAVLASGFPSPLPEHRELMAAVGPLELASLHVYGSGAAAGGGADAGANFDRQISLLESEALAAAFSCAGGRRRFLCHHSGHLIPATKSHAATFRTFLAQFLTAPATANSLPRQL